MQKLINNFREKIRVLKEKSARAQPEYTRKQWYIKCAQIVIGSVTISFLGWKLAWYDNEIYYMRLTHAQVLYGTPYIFYLIIQGFFIALTFWRILEIYWWAKNQCEKNDMYLHTE